MSKIIDKNPLDKLGTKRMPKNAVALGKAQKPSKGGAKKVHLPDNAVKVGKAQKPSKGGAKKVNLPQTAVKPGKAQKPQGKTSIAKITGDYQE